MKTISDVLSKTKIVKDLNNNFEPPKPTSEAVKLMNDLFDILRTHCKNFDYVLATNLDPSFCKREWLTTFAMHRMTKKQVYKGIERIRQNGYGKMIYPIDFINLCKPDPIDCGIPTLEKAFTEASRNSHPSSDKVWSHLVVEHAAKETGSWNLSNLPRSQVLPLFETNYTIAIRMFIDGNLKPIPKTLGSDDKGNVSVPCTKELAKAHLTGLKALLR